MFQKGYKMTEEHKRKISLANKGKIRTVEQKKNTSISTKLAMAKPEVKVKIEKTQFKKNHIPWNKDTHFSIEIRKKISESKKGTSSWNKGLDKNDSRVANMAKKQSETKKKKYESGELIIWNKNKLMSEDSKQKLSNTLKTQFDNGRKVWNKNIPCREESKLKISKAKKSVKLTKEHKKNISNGVKKHLPSTAYKKRDPRLIGENHHLWNNGITSLYKLIRELDESKVWKREVFKKDDFRCQECYKRGGNLEAHHNIKSFSIILQEFLNTYSQFSPIEDRETLIRLAITYTPFWDVSNGKTLCRPCHEKTFHCHKSENNK